MNKYSFTKGLCAVAMGAVLALGTASTVAYASVPGGPHPHDDGTIYVVEDALPETASFEEKYGERIPTQNLNDDQYETLDPHMAQSASFCSDATFSRRFIVNGPTTFYIAAGTTVEFQRGITVPEGSSLTITGEGTLVVNSLLYAGDESVGYAGIGGDPTHPNAGNITIEGVTVSSQAGAYAAGIGGGIYGRGGDITIDSSAHVTSIGGSRAAGIGGGYCGASGKIDIKGTVDAKGGFCPCNDDQHSDLTGYVYNAPAIGSGNFYHGMRKAQVFNVTLEQGSNVTVQVPNFDHVDAIGAGFYAIDGQLHIDGTVNEVK